MSTFSTGWFLVYTKPNQEKRVSTNLSQARIDHYLAISKSFRKRNERKMLVDVPLFPSYVFVFLQQMRDYYTAADTDGVLYFVRSCNKIAQVDVSVVDGLRMMVDSGREVEVVHEQFQPSEVLLIKDGSLTGMRCEVVRYKNKDKVLVRLTLLNRCVLADLPANYLMKA